jgi:2-polyprenyl-3-methyl-5-hydroxy-6-metoxy-1,4-benzoquinol methylase
MAASGYHEWINPNLVSALDPIAGRRVLEIGCGSGRLGEHMKAKGAGRYVGVELVPEVAERARPRLDAVYAGDIERMELPLADGSFDYLVLGDVLEHLVDPWTVLRRCARFLGPGGQVVTSIPNVNHATILCGLMEGRWEYTDAGLLDRTHLRFFTLVEIGRLFQDAGLVFDDVVACKNTTPELDAFVRDLDAVRRKYGIGSDRFAVEATTYQWLIKAHRAPAATG